MLTNKENNSRFQHSIWAAVFAFTAAFLWGWAYPLIKLGFAEFEITTEMTGSKILFASIWIWLTHLFYGIIFCITIIGIPFGKMHFRLAKLALSPFGKEVV